MTSQTDWNLILRHLKSESSAQDEDELRTWLASDPQHQKEMKLIERIWRSPGPCLTPSDVASAWNRIAPKQAIASSRREPSRTVLRIWEPQSPRGDIRPRQPVRTILRYAAVILLFLSLPVVYFWMKDARVDSAQHLERVVVSNGQQLKALLSDGTTVLLDAGSELQYPGVFSGDTREVTLKGEGYFEVTHDPRKPFIVHADHGIVKVIGTKFNICAWKELGNVRVAVLDGRVAVRSARQTDGVGVVLPKGTVSVLKEGSLSTSIPVKADMLAETAWRDNRLVLKNTPLREVIHKLERWYDLDIVLPGAIYNSTRVTGDFRKSSVEKTLKVIGLMIHLEPQRDGRIVRFSQRTSVE